MKDSLSTKLTPESIKTKTFAASKIMETCPDNLIIPQPIQLSNKALVFDFL